MTPWLRFASPSYKNTGSLARDLLASERTYLAWTRTGIGFIALGMAVERLSRFEAVALQGKKPPKAGEQEHGEAESSERLLVRTLVGLGTGCMVYATKRYFSVLRALEKDKFRPAYQGVLAMGTVLGGLGGALSTRTASDWVKGRSPATED